MLYSGGKITKKKWFYKTFPSLFCRSDLCLMLSARKSYFRSEMKPKTLVFALHFAHLFVTLAPPKLLSFGNETKNFGFCFAFRSLIRNFAPANQ